MKITVILLFVVINLFSYNIMALESGNEKLTTSPTHSNADCFEKKYEPKSEASIASMSPRQLIDELIESHPSAFRTYKEVADYQDSIEKRIRQTGNEALPVLIEHINNSFRAPDDFRCDNLRFSTVQRMAHDIDRFDFRLRGTDMGKRTVDAFERAVERVEKPGFTKKDVSYYRTMFLKDIKGINHIDRHIQDTFRVRYGIEMSESELVEFSNFLIELDPTYPSWSGTDFIKDYSQINGAGNPRQVYVLKDSERFYKAYQKFRKQTS